MHVACSEGFLEHCIHWLRTFCLHHVPSSNQALHMLTKPPHPHLEEQQWPSPSQSRQNSQPGCHAARPAMHLHLQQHMHALVMGKGTRDGVSSLHPSTCLTPWRLGRPTKAQALCRKATRGKDCKFAKHKCDKAASSGHYNCPCLRSSGRLTCIGDCLLGPRVHALSPPSGDKSHFEQCMDV